MKKKIRGWIINELADRLITLLATSYVYTEKAAHFVINLFFWGLQKIKSVGNLFGVLVLSVRDNFILRDKVKQSSGQEF